jgi:hypothetical protein
MLEMEKDTKSPIILGCTFLATAGALIDVMNGRLTLKVSEKEVEFNLFEDVKHPSFIDHVFQVDVVDGQLVKVCMKKIFLGSKRNVKDIFVFKFERDNKYDSLSF